MIIQRYTWEDAVLEAEQQGLLKAGAVNLCLRLAKAINWEPSGARDGMPSGLYWDNETALKAVGSSRATYFRHRAELFAQGFFVEVRGNLIPQVPALSQPDTRKSQHETEKSQLETDQSQHEHPYSENKYTDDLGSEDKDSKHLGRTEGPVEVLTTSPNREPKSLAVLSNAGGEVPQSQVETLEEKIKKLTIKRIKERQKVKV